MAHVSSIQDENLHTSTFDENERRSGSYVDWSCALGGATIAAAISSLLLAFGSGLGLSLLSPWPSERLNSTIFGIIMILWTVFVPLLSFAVGGYFAGRLRRPWVNLTNDEVAFRDGAHGALVWAASFVIGAISLAFLASNLASVGNTILSSGAATTSAPIMTRMVDEMFRSEQPTTESMRATREEAQRLIGSGNGMNLTIEDQSYLEGLVARSTGLPLPEAKSRIDSLMAQARNAAESARKAGIVAAFFAAATMMMGLAIAWFAAKKGGEHRDKR